METTVKRIVEKPQRIALCRRCSGTGRRLAGPESGLTVERHSQCPQCGGSGRVLVSCKMELDIRPYTR